MDTVDGDEVAAQAAAGEAIGDLSALELRGKCDAILEHVQGEIAAAIALMKRDAILGAASTLQALNVVVRNRRQELES